MLLPGGRGPQRQLRKQASLRAFLTRRDAPRLTALRLSIRGYENGVSAGRVLAALPPLHSVADLSVIVQWNVLCDCFPYTTFARDFQVLRAILGACTGLQQLRIHALTSGNGSVILDPLSWRAMFESVGGRGCLPQSSLRRLELSAAPGDVRLRACHDGTRFPSLAWLPELVLQSEHVQVSSVAPSSTLYLTLTATITLACV